MKHQSQGKKSSSAKKAAIGTGFITEVDRYLFGQGTHYQIYDKLGAHPKTYRGKKGMYFAVWAPHAKAVSVVGDFNGWDPSKAPMKPLADSGIFERFIPGLGTGKLYKYAIQTQKNEWILKADPYAFSAELRPGTASVTADISGFSWYISAPGKRRTEKNGTAFTAIRKPPMSWQPM